MHAADARGGKQFCKLLFRGSAFQGYAVEQQLRARSGKEQTRICAVWNRRAQFLPGAIELLDRPDMVEPVQTGKLQEDVQASDESPRRSRFGVDYFQLCDTRPNGTTSLVP